MVAALVHNQNKAKILNNISRKNLLFSTQVLNIMEIINIFYRIPSRKGSKIASFHNEHDGPNIAQFVDHIKSKESLDPRQYMILTGTKVIHPETCKNYVFKNNCQVDLCIPLCGGKGGFGSLLRAIGAQIEKTTNRDACRDLSGRRLRDVKREDELKKLIILQEKLLQEKSRRKKEKLERLKQKYESDDTEANTSIQELVNMFDDNEYQKRRLKIDDIVRAAVEKGIINSKKRQNDESRNDSQDKDDACHESKKAKRDGESPSSSGCLEEAESVDYELPSKESGTKPDKLEQATESDKQSESKSNKPVVNKNKKYDVWLGIDEDEDDDD